MEDTKYVSVASEGPRPLYSPYEKQFHLNIQAKPKKIIIAYESSERERDAEGIHKTQLSF